VDVAISAYEAYILLDAAGPDPAYVRLLDATEPDPIAPPDGTDVKAIAVADDPDGDRLSQRAVAPERRNLHLLRASDLGELVLGPLGHRPASYLKPLPSDGEPGEWARFCSGRLLLEKGESRRGGQSRRT